MKFTEEQIAAALSETSRLTRELDITNPDHIALWLEANMANSPLGWLACCIVEAHEAAIADRSPKGGDGEAGSIADESAGRQASSEPCPPDARAVVEAANKIDQQADCLDHYAEMSGFKKGPLPSVFHLQSSHFRDIAKELRAVLQSGASK